MGDRNDSFKDELLEFARDAKEVIRLCKNNEQQTKNSLVEPYIKLLGFDPSDVHQVRVEYQTATVRAADRVDYALMDGSSPFVFVEAKSLAHKDVASNTHMNKQLRSYMLDSETVKFGALTDGQRWLWYYKQHNRVEPVLFLDVDALTGSQDESAIEWTSGLKQRATVNELLNAARTLFLTSRIKKWIVDSLKKPSDALARVLLKEIGESGSGRARLEQCKRGWKRAMRDLSGDRPPSPIKRLTPPDPRTPKPPVGPPLGKACVLQHPNGQWETFPNATGLLFAIVRYCATQHNRGEQDYYNRIKKPLPGTSRYSAWITETDYESITNRKKYYSSMSENGYRIFRNLSNARKVDFIKALLNECVLVSGDTPQIGRELQLQLPNTSLQISNRGMQV